MKLKQMTFGPAVVAALAFGAASAFAMPSISYPQVPLAISGTVYYSPNNDYNVQGVPLRAVSFTTATLIALLNNSYDAQSDIYENATFHGGPTEVTTQIPAGSYFVWDADHETLNITNANGFFMLGSDLPGLYIDSEDQHLCGTYSLAPNGSGTETDVMGIYFEFSDGNEELNRIEILGTATMTWTYGPVSGGNQRATLTVTISGDGEDGSWIDDIDYAVTTSFSASGTGSVVSFPATAVPFFFNY